MGKALKQYAGAAEQNDNSRDFLRIVRINEGIKTIADLSFHIRLRALNALVTSLKSGEAIDGMAVVARKMIEYSSELEKEAHVITKETHAILVFQTLLTKSRQKKRFFLLTHRQIARQYSGDIGTKQRGVDTILNRFDQDRTGMIRSVEKGMVQFAKQIRSFLRLIMTGRVLGTLAKIEAAHTKASSGYFSELAKNFDDSRNTIESILKDLDEEIRSIT